MWMFEVETQDGRRPRGLGLDSGRAGSRLAVVFRVEACVAGRSALGYLPFPKRATKTATCLSAVDRGPERVGYLSKRTGAARFPGPGC